jgi:hypothetical protein
MTRRVYFIRAIGRDDSMVKIGHSVGPGGRRDQLQAWTPYPLEVAAEIDGGLTLERQFHALFLGQHFKAEWFHSSPALSDVIEQIRSGTFDVNTLPEPVDLRRLAGNYPTGPRPDIRERNRLSRMIREAERDSGLVCDYPHTAERIAAFIADPHTHGVTAQVREQGVKKRTIEGWREQLGPVVVAGLSGQPA